MASRDTTNYNVSVYIDFLSAIHDFFNWFVFHILNIFCYLYFITLPCVMYSKIYRRFYIILSTDTKNKLSLTTYLKMNK